MTTERELTEAIDEIKRAGHHDLETRATDALRIIARNQVGRTNYPHSGEPWPPTARQWLREQAEAAAAAPVARPDETEEAAYRRAAIEFHAEPGSIYIAEDAPVDVTGSGALVTAQIWIAAETLGPEPANRRDLETLLNWAPAIESDPRGGMDDAND